VTNTIVNQFLGNDEFIHFMQVIQSKKITHVIIYPRRKVGE